MMPRTLKIKHLCFCGALLFALSGHSHEIQAQGYQLNGSAGYLPSANPHEGPSYPLTNGGKFEAGSIFVPGRRSISFDGEFGFFTPDTATDGFAFVIQGNGPNALGSPGGGIGYGNPPGGTGASITNSVAIVFDTHNNQGEGDNSLRLEYNGVTMGGGAIDLTPSGINLHLPNHYFMIFFNYDFDAPRRLDFSIVDYGGSGSPQHEFNISWTLDIEKLIGGPMGYLGFTGGTGVSPGVITIAGWQFDPGDNFLPSYPAPNYNDGFAGATDLQLNGGASISGSDLVLTHGKQFEATSAYFNQKLPLHDVKAPNDNFYIDFDFQIANGAGDGFTFVLQDDKLTAVGPTGGGLGYGPYVYIQPPYVSANEDTCISEGPNGPSVVPPCPGGGIQHSLAVKFDLHNNQGEGVNSTGFYFNGLSPTIPAIDLGASGINLHSGHTFHARIGTVGTPGNSDLKLTITDLDVYKVFTTTQHIAASTPSNPFSLLPGSAWAGFTAGTGATPSNITIKNWTWTII